MRAPDFLVARAHTWKNQNFFFPIFHFFNFQNVIYGRLIYEFCFGRNMLGPYAWVVVDINQFSQIGLERAESVPTYREKWHYKSGRNFWLKLTNFKFFLKKWKFRASLKTYIRRSDIRQKTMELSHFEVFSKYGIFNTFGKKISNKIFDKLKRAIYRMFCYYFFPHIC